MRTKPLIAALICAVLAVASILAILATQDRVPKQVSEEDRLREFYRTADFVGIGYVQTEDDDRVLELLDGTTSINSAVHGGHGLTFISTVVDDAPRAIALIKEDAKKHGYEFFEGLTGSFKLID